MKRIPFVLCSSGILVATVVWTIQSSRIVFIFLYGVYVGLVFLSGSMIKSEAFKMLVRKRAEWGTEFFVWFLFVLSVGLLVFVSAGALGLFGDVENLFVWQVPFYVVGAGCVSAFHAVFALNTLKGTKG